MGVGQQLVPVSQCCRFLIAPWGEGYVMPIPAAAVVVLVSDLPALLADPSVVSAALAADCRRALDDR
jgi:hypothetical protein